MEIDKIVTEFKDYLKVCGYAQTTVECYSVYLGYFVNYVKAEGLTDLKKVSSKTVRSYQLQVIEQPLAEETKALRIRPVKRLFGWLLDNHRLLLDPTEKIRESNRRGRTLPEVLTILEMKKLLAVPDLSLQVQRRDRTMMELLYSSGIRLNEMVSLTVPDVDLKERTLNIRKGKGNRQRVVPIGKTAVQYLQEYLTEIRPRFIAGNGQERCLFVTCKGKSVTGNTVRAALRRYRKRAGIDKPVSPHTFRRSCASHLLQEGADVRYVQQLLGHRHLKTTQLYTRVYPVDLKRTHERTHPKL